LESFSEISYIFDIWSFGSILVEILSGFPLWLSLKSRVQAVDGRSIVNCGLFGVAGRDNSKILKRQFEVMGQGIGTLLLSLKKGFDFQGQNWASDSLFVDLLNSIICMEPY
jgi:serine/threonine protein kinase